MWTIDGNSEGANGGQSMEREVREGCCRMYYNTLNECYNHNDVHHHGCFSPHNAVVHCAQYCMVISRGERTTKNRKQL